MSDTCRVILAVTIEGLSSFGQTPTTAAYVCSAAGIYAAPAAPIVCSSAMVATAVGVWATSPAGKELMNLAADRGCVVVARGAEILIIEGARTKEAFEKTAEEAEATYKALNTAQGVSWLMRYLTSR